MRSGLRKPVAAALLGAMTGCTAVRPVVAPAPFISSKHPDVIYVWDKQGRVFSIARPVVQGDSVVGVSPRLDKSVGLPLSSVSRVAAAQADHGRTALLAILLGGGAGGLLYALAHAGTSQPCDAIMLDPKNAQTGTQLCN